MSHLRRAAWALALSVTGCASSTPAASPPRDVAQQVPLAVPRRFEGPEVAGIVAGLSGEVAARLRAHEVSRLEAQSACLEGHGCTVASMPPLDEGIATALLAVRARDPRIRSAQAMAARAMVEATLGVAAAERSARRRALTFKEDAAVFALDDLELLLEHAPRERRGAWLAAARPAVALALDIGAEERAVLDALAARLGTTRAALLAQRAGLEEKDLRVLVTDALRATVPLLAGGSSEVTLLPDVHAAARGPAPRVALSPAAAGGDPILVDAVALAGRLVGGGERTVSRLRALVVELRALALASSAVLDGADLDARDALGSRILDDSAAPVPGAAALLPADEGGVVIERFVAALRAPAIAQALSAGAPLDEVLVAWRGAPVVEEQGFPEAFVEVVRALEELAR